MSDVGFSFHFELMAAGLVLGYLLGSIPLALFFPSPRARATCARSPGAISVPPMLRTGQEMGGCGYRLLCDAAKGAVAILLARYFLDGYR